MSQRIEDGRGNRYETGVDETHRLLTRAVSKNTAESQTDEGKTWMVPTDFVSLAAADGESAILYLKYTGSGHLHIYSLRMSSTVEAKFRLYTSSTGGTITTAGTAITPPNASKIFEGVDLSAVTYKAAASGQTCTGGTLMGQAVVPNGAIDMETGAAIQLGTNDIACITAEPTVDGDVGSTWILFEETEEHV